jgi:UDPglucose--hexose-1-phosphate uridylyltransferase
MTPEYRTCPVSGRTVILAPDRAERPIVHGVPPRHEETERAFCPFCPGNEWDTPGEVFAIADENGWQLRVVPNKFPAVRRVESVINRCGEDRSLTLPARPASGFHEVVIECREHWDNPTQLSDAQFANIFVAYRERMKAMRADSAIKSASAFKNVGAEAGASLPHLHSQLLATPFVPETLQAELNGAKRYYDSTNRNIFMDMMNDVERIVHQNDMYIVLCPYAPRFEYEMWLFPVAPQPSFEMISDAECLELARVLKRTLSTLDRVLDAPAWNWLLHSAPAGEPYYQWHLEILPRTTRPAGYEWATGVFINPVLPEEAAQQLRASSEPEA